MRDFEVVITLIDDLDNEQEYRFDEPQLCIVGRAQDCDIHTAGGDETLVISRHHCLLQIDPPRIRIHDLGSTNGTYVNGIRLPRGRTRRAHRQGIQLVDGDKVTLGPITLRINLPAIAQAPAPSEFALEFDDLLLEQPGGALTERTVDGWKVKREQQSPVLMESVGASANAGDGRHSAVVG